MKKWKRLEFWKNGKLKHDKMENLFSRNVQTFQKSVKGK